MDLNMLGLHIHEIKNQCSYIEGNVSILNSSMESDSRVGAFLSLQGIMQSAAQISRMLWAPRKKGKARSEQLRKFLGLSEEHPLNNSDIASLFDNIDEVNEEWIKKSKGKYILYDYIGDLANSKHKDVEMDYIFRSYDTASKIYVYRGKGFNMDSMLIALKDISDCINKAHYHLFPDQWKNQEGTDDAKEKSAQEPIVKEK